MGNPLRNILSRIRDSEADDLPNPPKKGYNKNDLLQVSNKGKAIDFTEILKTFSVIQKSGFSSETVTKTKKNNIAMREYLELTDSQYLLMVILIHKLGRATNPSSIVSLIRGQNNITPKIADLLFELYHRGYVAVVPEDSDVRFHCSHEFISYINSGEFKHNENVSLKTIIRDCDTIANLFNAPMPYSMTALNNIIAILTKYSTYDYCKALLAIQEQCTNVPDELEYNVFLFYIIGQMILGGDSTVLCKNSQYLEIFCRYINRESLINNVFYIEDNILFKNKIFDRAIDESGKADKDKIELHADFKRKYLKGIIVEKKLDIITKNDKIIKKEMFYNEDNEKQITDLSTILARKQFDKVKNRLKKSGMRTGFACLFSGYAGTGKTETVYQIAKKTGRDIIKVDMSAIRSKWWGEDEKNIKAVFTNYKLALQDSKIEPILLLNEADAIIGKRLDVTGNNGAIINAINTTQNIILEELENFEGILIATTNLTQNFDSAFERRFLYKIEFQKPDVSVKQKLWSHMLKLNEEDSTTLAKKFDFTGAQIENIFRKREVNNILYGEEHNLDKIIEFCEKELLSDKTKPIGFCQ